MENKFDFNKQSSEWLLTEILNKQSNEANLLAEIQNKIGSTPTFVQNFFDANQFISLYESLQYGQTIEIVKLIVNGSPTPTSDITIKIVDISRSVEVNIVIPKIGSTMILENFKLEKFFTPSGYVDIRYTTAPYNRITEKFYMEYRII